ncbi:unknown [Anaerotruncus sp. CAG:390]|nr:unknown [Anaerotruncus sp. CAG:390]
MSKRRAEAQLFKLRYLVVFNEIDLSRVARCVAVLAGNDELHHLFVFAEYCRLLDARQHLVAALAGQPPYAAHKHVGKRMEFVFCVGQALNAAERVGIYLVKAVLAFSEVPELQLLYLLHYPYSQGIIRFFVHSAHILSYSLSAVAQLPLDRSRRNAQSVCDLGYRKPLEIVQAYYLSHPRGESFNAPKQLALFFGSHIKLCGVLIAVGKAFKIFDSIERNEFVIAHNGVARTVFCYFCSPCAEFLRFGEGIELHPRRHERLLRRILGNKCVACDRRRRRHHPLLVSHDEHLICPLLSCEREHNERLVVFVSVKQYAFSFRFFMGRSSCLYDKREERKVGYKIKIFSHLRRAEKNERNV